MLSVVVDLKKHVHFGLPFRCWLLAGKLGVWYSFEWQLRIQEFKLLEEVVLLLSQIDIHELLLRHIMKVEISTHKIIFLEDKYSSSDIKPSS